MKQPNILIIMSDQHNPHIMGCAGDRVVRTPNIDKLAGQGVRFSHAYCGGPLCVPSRMTFLTGRNCSDINVFTNSGVLASDIPTFAHALGAAGYETVLCGRMHLSRDNPQHGFEKKLVGDVSTRWSSRAGGSLFGDIPKGLNSQKRISVEIAGPGRTSYQAFDRDVASAAVEFINNRSGEKRPFCLVVGFVLPHNPLICPRELFDEYFPQMDIPRMTDEEKKKIHPAVQKWREAHGVDNLSNSQVRTARAAYYGLVTMVDSFVGEVTGTLEKKGLHQNTAVFYTSDHGEMAGEHEMWWKSNFYEGSAGVPLIASFPGTFLEGKICSHPVSLLDIAPTLLELGGAGSLPRITGKSIMHCLKGSCGGKQEKDIFSELYDTEVETPVRMVVRWPWKLVYYHGYEQPLLFNLEKDPGEINDCGREDVYDIVKKELLAALKDGWDAERIIKLRKEEIENQEIIAGWTSKVKAPDRDCWEPPAGSNLFPE